MTLKLTQRDIITQLLPNRDILSARKALADLGKELPRAASLIDPIVESRPKDPKSTREYAFQSTIFFPAWALELVAHPRSEERFSRGKDIVDWHTHWTIPWSELMKHVGWDDINGSFIGLMVVPETLDKMPGSRNSPVIVIPREVIVVTLFMQSSGLGELKPELGIPLITNGERLGNLHQDKLGYLERDYRESVRPMRCSPHAPMLPILAGRQPKSSVSTMDSPLAQRGVGFVSESEFTLRGEPGKVERMLAQLKAQEDFL